MAELVDATDLKSVDLLIVRVRFPLSVFIKCPERWCFDDPLHFGNTEV